MIKPQAHLTVNGKLVVKYASTYVKLKRSLKRYIEMTDDAMVHVYRTRRGEWGEWFEHWGIDNGKATITKSGWS